MKLPRKLVATEDADIVTAQPKIPCDDCPFTRQSLPGWLGGDSAASFIGVAQTDQVHLCHALKLPGGKRVQCAGIAIFRRNLCKTVELPNLTLEADRKTVFANALEFASHHLNRAVTPEELTAMMIQRMSLNKKSNARKRSVSLQ